MANVRSLTMAFPLGFMGSSKNASHHWFNDLKSMAAVWLDSGLRGLDEQLFDVFLLLYLLLCTPDQVVRRIGLVSLRT